MPINKKHIVIERRHRIAELYLKGWPQYKIAEQVGVTQQQVSNDIRAMSKQWQQSSMVDMNEAKAKELAKIDNLEQEYWTAWEKSKEDFQQKITKAKGTNESVKALEKTTKEVVVYGDPRFLAGIQWCIGKRCDIIGIDAPKQSTMKIVDEFANKTEEELERIANGGK